MNDQKKSTVTRSVSTTAAAKRAQSVGGQDFVRGVITELRRVTWPTQEEWVSATILTIGLVVGIGLFTFLADQLFGWVFNMIHPQNF